MEKYQRIEEVGRGSYGVVWKSLNKQTGEIVAIKKIKTMHLSSKESMDLTDVKSLVKMNHHPNIVKLKEIIRENHKSFLVFEYMECSLYKSIVERKKPFSETEVRNLCFQVFKGLAYMHRNGYFHHDLKPDSFLVNKNVIKIGDLGHAREMNGNSPCTDYVAGCWYRAPEAILDLSVYDYAVDMWAMGAIMVELFTLKPVFQGSCEADVLYKICSVLGTPKDQDLASDISFFFPELPGVPFSDLLPYASPDAVNLIATLLSWHPSNRPTAMEALRHPFFNSCYYAPSPPVLPHELALQHPFSNSCCYAPSVLPHVVALQRPFSNSCCYAPPVLPHELALQHPFSNSCRYAPPVLPHELASDASSLIMGKTSSKRNAGGVTEAGNKF